MNPAHLVDTAPAWAIGIALIIGSAAYFNSQRAKVNADRLEEAEAMRTEATAEVAELRIQMAAMQDNFDREFAELRDKLDREMRHLRAENVRLIRENYELQQALAATGYGRGE